MTYAKPNRAEEMNPRSSSMAAPLEYIALESNERKLIILPVIAARNCEVIKDMLHAVSAFQLYRLNGESGACTPSASPSALSSETMITTSESAQRMGTCDRAVTAATPNQIERESGLNTDDVNTDEMRVTGSNEEARARDYHCMGVPFTPLGKGTPHSSGQGGVCKLLRIPLLCIRHEALVRIATFLVCKSSSAASEIGEECAFDIFDSDRGSETNDLLRMVRLTCGVDFLEL